MAAKIKILSIVFIFSILTLTNASNAADLSALLNAAGISKQSSLSGTKIGEGLKEALRVGIDKTVQATGKKDGYFANEAIKILMPEKLKTMEGLLRKVGMGSKVDEFVLSMNRAAEKAAPYARDIFIDAIVNMSIQDAESLLKGGDTAATEYFKKTTSTKLAQVYKPIVTSAMAEYNVTHQYQALTGKYQSLPFASKLPLPSIEDYTVNKSLDGIFLVLGQQEKEIRTNPSARATQILKDVFKN